MLNNAVQKLLVKQEQKGVTNEENESKDQIDVQNEVDDAIRSFAVEPNLSFRVSLLGIKALYSIQPVLYFEEIIFLACLELELIAQLFLSK